MAKILLELYDGIVNDASIITQQEIDSTVKTPPYYSVPSEISGKSFDQLVSEMNLRGRYSHALRKKDLRASRGKNMEIMIVNGDDPSSFWCKKYDSAKKKFVNVDGESDV
ncbi:MAG: hypothetical protein NTW48_09310, partial [Chloroflexi bacterium]|nr:hypothetical protein [Chloroflexota bacterium]